MSDLFGCPAASTVFIMIPGKLPEARCNALQAPPMLTTIYLWLAQDSDTCIRVSSAGRTRFVSACFAIPAAADHGNDVNDRLT